MNTMTDETHLDGNALGGLLHEVFGREMTDARGCCGTCGTVNHVGRMLVYRGPGDVMRCPTCGSVVIVAVTIHDRTRVHVSSLRWLEPIPRSAP
jgi:uncharacterized Zn finger protein